MKWWIKLIIIVAMLPVLAYPKMLADSSPEAGSEGTFLWIYPAYVLAAGICAWISWKKRPEITWILVVLLILTHVAMWILVSNTSL